ncbi:MAG TPA: DUF559 domain-containing protein [Candidatus Dormibacteraeota bacterium]
MRGPEFVPPELRNGPFTLAAALDAGLVDDQLRSDSFRRIGPRTYTWIKAPEDHFRLLTAIATRLPPSSAFSGRAALWLAGLDIRPDRPVDVTVPTDAGVSNRAGVRFHRRELPEEEVVSRRGLKATSVPRSLSDVAHWEQLEEAVVIADMALNQRLVERSDLAGRVADRRGRWGVKRFRRVVDLVEPLAQSAMESRLRLRLVLAGLPAPQAQVALTDANGLFLGRADLYYADARLVIEYDGGNHRTRLVEDNRRQNRLLNAGYRMLRFTAADVLGNPDAVASQVRAALALAIPGFPGNRRPSAA